MRFIFKNLKKLINIKGIMDNSSEKIFGKNEHKELSSDMEKIVGKNDLLLNKDIAVFDITVFIVITFCIINSLMKGSYTCLVVNLLTTVCLKEWKFLPFFLMPSLRRYLSNQRLIRVP